MKTFLVIAGLVAIAAIIIYFANINQNNGILTEGNGRAIFAVTDVAADMGAVSAINLTVDRAQIHSSSEGWVTISEQDAVFDLIKLKTTGAAEILADVQLKEGNYDQLSLDIKNVTVVDASGQHTAKLPSNVLRVNVNTKVEANSTSSIVIDFKASESLHITGKGEYVLFPVMKVETKNNVATSAGTGKTIIISGGEVQGSVSVGMDLNGDFKINLQIPAKAIIKIENNLIKIEGEGTLEPIGQACLAKCSQECATTVLAQCRNQCDITADLACSASTEAECQAKCGIGITQVACRAACALESKTSCLASFRADCKNNCELNVPACQSNCQVECR